MNRQYLEYIPEVGIARKEQRCTTYFAGVIVLLAFGALVMAAISSHFDGLDREELSGKLDYAAQLVASMERPLSKEAVAKALASSFAGHHELVMQVRGPSGVVWFASSAAVRIRADSHDELTVFCRLWGWTC